MTTEEIHCVTEVLLRELEAVKDSANAQGWRRVLVRFALEGVRMQTLADARRAAER